MGKRIYVADDEKNIRELIRTFLNNEGYEVQTFETGDALFEKFLSDPADLVVLDVMMQGTDGFMLSGKLREISNVPIIIVSARDSEMDRITGISLGSDDYLTKPFSPMELVARVKAIFRRIELDSDNSKKPMGELVFGDIRIDTQAHLTFINEEKIDLTPTEFALMVYFMNEPGRAVSREELLKNVWKFDFDVDTRATDDVIKRLRKKLSSKGSSVIIESVWGVGFRLSEQK